MDDIVATIILIIIFVTFVFRAQCASRCSNTSLFGVCVCVFWRGRPHMDEVDSVCESVSALVICPTNESTANGVRIGLIWTVLYGLEWAVAHAGTACGDSGAFRMCLYVCVQMIIHEPFAVPYSEQRRAWQWRAFEMRMLMQRWICGFPNSAFGHWHGNRKLANAC